MSNRLIVIILLCITLAGCFGGGKPFDPTPDARAPKDNKLPTGDQGGYEKVGNPYKIDGKWYYPKRDPNYDETGLASWYGKQFHGRKTANGEVFNMNALTAAHKTLPMPSYVKVTNLSNGRSLTLRVNDRGPFVGDRIIDVSRRAAQLLGFDKKGVTRVRIQTSDENGKVLAKQSNGQSGKTRHYVQLGAFSNKATARDIQRRANAAGTDATLSDAIVNGKKLWRVRAGPYKKLAKAQRVLDQLLARGFYEARIFTDVP